ncbi:unnamed protein product [Urochloa decumbens]|uniref:Uncharacterized protein n=1 Tax=Urochloa decumbens TaxID=240449 RepID=A0ABC9G7Q9_9POAL
MTFVLVDHDDSSDSAAGDRDSTAALQPLCIDGGGHYRPAAAATGAGALHWLPFAAAVSVTRALLGASHEDLRLRANLLSRSLSAAFFFPGGVAGAPAPPAAGAIAGVVARFPEGGLYVCPDLPPLAPAVRAVQRALMQVAVLEASHGACDCFYDTVRDVMWQLVGDAPDGRGPAVFDREKFEAAFALEWVE